MQKQIIFPFRKILIFAQDRINHHIIFLVGNEKETRENRNPDIGDNNDHRAKVKQEELRKSIGR